MALGDPITVSIVDEQVMEIVAGMLDWLQGKGMVEVTIDE